MSTRPTSDRWVGYSAALRAILDEYARAIADLERLVCALSQDQYRTSTKLSDDTFADIRSIMFHVAGAAHAYVDYVDDATSPSGVGGRRAHDFRYDTPNEAIDAVWEAFGRMAGVLEPIKASVDEDLEKVTLITRWGQHYDLEQLLEHAIVHILRHRRQIERWLAA